MSVFRSKISSWVAAFTGFASVISASWAESRPNVFIFLSDDLSYHDLGCYGNTVVKTPNIDALATEGLLLEACFNSAPMCAPTRMSLYSGIHPVRNGAHPNHSEVYPWVKTLPTYLKALGYRVGLANKSHYLPKEQFPFEHLEGREHDNGKNGIDFDMARVEAFLNASQDGPWCFVFASNQPHAPWNRGDATQYDPSAVSIPPYLVDTPETREAMTRYYAEISYMDNQLGQCIQFLEDLGQTEETLFLYLSEQGSNFPFCKWTCYETGLRSAGIIRWPGKVKAGRTSSELLQYVDVLPTLVDIAGGNALDHDFDGKSFKGLLLDQVYDPNTFAYGVQTSRGIYSGPEGYGIRSIRDARYRLIWNVNAEAAFQNTVTNSLEAYLSWERRAQSGDAFAQERFQAYRKRPEYELYDAIADPFCMDNLVASPEVRGDFKRLKAGLEAWMELQGDRGAATEAAALTRMPARRGE